MKETQKMIKRKIKGKTIEITKDIVFYRNKHYILINADLSTLL